MAKLDNEQIYSVVNALIGDFEPIGESNYDKKCLDGLKEQTYLVSDLISDIGKCLAYVGCYQASMRDVGEFARKHLVDLRDDIDRWLEYADENDR